MAVRSFLTAAILATSALAVPHGEKRQATSSAPSNTNPTTTIIATATAKNFGLDDAAKQAGKLWFGTAADIPGTDESNDRYYLKEFNNKHDFGEATPANIMKVSRSSRADVLMTSLAKSMQTE